MKGGQEGDDGAEPVDEPVAVAVNGNRAEPVAEPVATAVAEPVATAGNGVLPWLPQNQQNVSQIIQNITITKRKLEEMLDNQLAESFTSALQHVKVVIDTKLSETIANIKVPNGVITKTNDLSAPVKQLAEWQKRASIVNAYAANALANVAKPAGNTNVNAKRTYVDALLGALAVPSENANNNAKNAFLFSRFLADVNTSVPKYDNGNVFGKFTLTNDALLEALNTPFGTIPNPNLSSITNKINNKKKAIPNANKYPTNLLYQENAGKNNVAGIWNKVGVQALNAKNDAYIEHVKGLNALQTYLTKVIKVDGKDIPMYAILVQKAGDPRVLNVIQNILVIKGVDATLFTLTPDKVVYGPGGISLRSGLPEGDSPVKSFLNAIGYPDNIVNLNKVTASLLPA